MVLRVTSSSSVLSTPAVLPPSKFGACLQLPLPRLSLCLRWAQVTRFLVIVDKALNQTHRVYSRKRADLLSESTLHRTREQADSERSLTSWAGGVFCSYRADSSWLVLAAFIAHVQVVALL